MNERLKLGIAKRVVNVRMWVLAAPKLPPQPSVSSSNLCPL